MKNHQKLHLQAGILVKVHHSNAKEHDSMFIQNEDVVHKNEIVAFDKVYNNYALFDKWCEQKIFFVSSLKDNAMERFIEEKDLLGGTTDEVLRILRSPCPTRTIREMKRKQELRLVSYYDPEREKAFYFLTNLFDEDAGQIALLYK